MYQDPPPLNQAEEHVSNYSALFRHYKGASYTPVTLRFKETENMNDWKKIFITLLQIALPTEHISSKCASVKRSTQNYAMHTQGFPCVKSSAPEHFHNFILNSLDALKVKTSIIVNYNFRSM